jgi:hypothetical protein
MNMETLYQQALLAQAAYVINLFPDDPAIINKLTADSCGMTQTQAERFAEEWRVVDQYTDASGVSATVFEEKAT